MPRRNKAIDQRFIISGECMVERSQICPPLIRGAWPGYDAADDIVVQHPQGRKFSRCHTPICNVLFDSLDDIIDFRPEVTVQDARIAPSAAAVRGRRGALRVFSR